LTATIFFRPTAQQIEEAAKVTRWTRCLLFGAIAVLVVAVAGCEAGQDAPTQEFHQASNGTSTTVGGITIDDAFVLGPPLNSVLPAGGQAGVFLSLFAQNGDRLLSATAPAAAKSVTLTSGPVTLPAQTDVDLSGPQPQIVLTGLTNPLSGGEMIQLELVFSNEGTVPISVPVEAAAYEYTTYSPPPAPAPTPSAKHKARHKSSATASASPSPTS
jgi:copper(I)-binding protein